MRKKSRWPVPYQPWAGQICSYESCHASGSLYFKKHGNKGYFQQHQQLKSAAHSRNAFVKIIGFLVPIQSLGKTTDYNVKQDTILCAHFLTKNSPSVIRVTSLAAAISAWVITSGRRFISKPVCELWCLRPKPVGRGWEIEGSSRCYYPSHGWGVGVEGGCRCWSMTQNRSFVPF